LTTYITHVTFVVHQKFEIKYTSAISCSDNPGYVYCTFIPIRETSVV